MQPSPLLPELVDPGVQRQQRHACSCRVQVELKGVGAQVGGAAEEAVSGGLRGTMQIKGLCNGGHTLVINKQEQGH